MLAVVVDERAAIAPDQIGIGDSDKLEPSGPEILVPRMQARSEDFQLERHPVGRGRHPSVASKWSPSQSGNMGGRVDWRPLGKVYTSAIRATATASEKFLRKIMAAKGQGGAR